MEKGIALVLKEMLMEVLMVLLHEALLVKMTNALAADCMIVCLHDDFEA